MNWMLTDYTLSRMDGKILLGKRMVRIESNVTGCLPIPIFYKWLKTFIVSLCVGIWMIWIEAGVIGRLVGIILSKWLGTRLISQASRYTYGHQMSVFWYNFFWVPNIGPMVRTHRNLNMYLRLDQIYRRYRSLMQ